MYQVYGMAASGNCYKVKLLLNQLGVKSVWHETDTRKGETRTQVFLAMNPVGKVPVLILEDGRILPESNAILCYLADTTPLLPKARFEHAQVMQWMFFEQYSHEPYIAVARAIKLFFPQRQDELPALWAKGYQALDVLEQHLSRHEFMVDSQYSIADIALYAYTHVAEQGGFDMSRYPSIRNWLGKVARQPGYIPLG